MPNPDFTRRDAPSDTTVPHLNRTFADQLAIDRTMLAHERTFLAYLRTGLTLFAVGVTFIKLLDDLWIIATGYLLVPLGVGVFAVGIINRRKLRKLDLERK